MTLEQDENDGMFSVVMPSVKPAMRDWVTNWQVENVRPFGGRRSPGTSAITSRSSNSFMPIGKVRRCRSWFSCSASTAMALPSSGEASAMTGASFIVLLRESLQSQWRKSDSWSHVASPLVWRHIVEQPAGTVDQDANGKRQALSTMLMIAALLAWWTAAPFHGTINGYVEEQRIRRRNRGRR